MRQRYWLAGNHRQQQAGEQTDFILSPKSRIPHLAHENQPRMYADKRGSAQKEAKRSESRLFQIRVIRVNLRLRIVLDSLRQRLTRHFFVVEMENVAANDLIIFVTFPRNQD